MSSAFRLTLRSFRQPHKPSNDGAKVATTLATVWSRYPDPDDLAPPGSDAFRKLQETLAEANAMRVAMGYTEVPDAKA